MKINLKQKHVPEKGGKWKTYLRCNINWKEKPDIKLFIQCDLKYVT